MVADYFLTLAAIYAAMLILYFGFGLIAEAYAARFPDRKIQPERDGMKRKRAEILNSLPALAMSSFLLGTGYFAQTQGWTMAPADLGVVSFVLSFVVSLILFDAWFYFGHRLLHWPPMYRYHALHHKSVAPTVGLTTAQAWSIRSSNTAFTSSSGSSCQCRRWRSLPCACSTRSAA